MASALMRASILRRIRVPAAQTLITLNGCKLTGDSSLRSLSSHADPKLSGDLSLRSLSSHANPKLSGDSSLRSLSDPTDPKLSGDSSLRSLSDEDQINSAAALIIQIIDRFIKTSPNHPNPELVDFASYLIGRLPKIKHYPEPSKFQIMSRVLDVIQNYPKVDAFQVYRVRTFIRSWSSDDSEDDLTKDQVISRVLHVIKSCPSVCHSIEVTEESHFYDDLGLDESESENLLVALRVEFKLYIPDKEAYYSIDSCKLAIDYIYDHRMDRICMKEFRKGAFKYVPPGSN